MTDNLSSSVYSVDNVDYGFLMRISKKYKYYVQRFREEKIEDKGEEYELLISICEDLDDKLISITEKIDEIIKQTIKDHSGEKKSESNNDELYLLIGKGHRDGKYKKIDSFDDITLAMSAFKDTKKKMVNRKISRIELIEGKTKKVHKKYNLN